MARAENDAVYNQAVLGQFGVVSDGILCDSIKATAPFGNIINCQTYMQSLDANLWSFCAKYFANKTVYVSRCQCTKHNHKFI